MLRKTCSIALLLVGLVGVLGQLALAQAVLDFTFAPASPSVNEEVCFTAVVTSGDPTWFVLYEWDFNQDGVYDATGPNACHTFPSAGTKIVTLRGTDDRGGFYPVQKAVVVINEIPTAAFSYSPLFPNAGDLVSFDASASFDPDGAIVTYEWDFDNDGTYDGTGRTIRHTYGVSGQRPVMLRVTDNGGATDTVLHTVSVQPIPPAACFTYSPLAPSVYDVIQFTAACSTDPDGGPIVQYNWAFGDGGAGTGQNPSHQYANGGSYEVFLTVTDDDQQTHTFSDTVEVDGPSAAFSYAPLSPTTQNPVQFFDQSSDTSGNIASWSWDFTDGGFSSTQNPLYTFAQSGVYRVGLTVTSAGGATSSTIRTIVVLNAPPQADYTFTPETPKVDQMVTFSAGGSGDPDGTVILYEWDFDNDGLTDATGSTVTHAFSVVGARLVRLTVTDNEGAAASVTHVVPVQAAPPVACYDFTPAEPNTGQAIGFDASCSADADGTIILYEWDFNNDGLTDGTGMSVTHSFPTVGVYPVALTVTDNDGAVDVNIQGVPVAVGGTSGDNQPPEGDFTFEPAEDPDVNLNEVVTFRSDGSSDPDGSIVAYEWDFDRDGVYDATGAISSHIFHTGGAKIVTLRVTDDDGAFGFKTRVVSVEFVRPNADFSFTPQQPQVGDVVTFDGSGSSDLDGTIEFYEWDFDNDGQADATGQTVNRVFTNGGNLPITLMVTDNDGVTDFITRSINMAINSVPIASFSYTPANPTTSDNIAFSSSSFDDDGSITGHLWDFGDAATTSTQTPSHRYATAGTFTVTLTVTDNRGATGQTTTGILVTAVTNVAPVANFQFAPVQPRVDEEVSFQDSSTDAGGSIVSWLWDFGDGSATSDVRNPKHTYVTANTFTVTLTVTDDLGESNNTTKRVNVGSTSGAAITLFGYPNPASRVATVNYFLPDGATSPELRVFDLSRGEILRQALSAGGTEFEWDLRDEGGTAVSNGLYLCMITATSATDRTITSDVFRLLVVR